MPKARRGDRPARSAPPSAPCRQDDQAGAGEDQVQRAGKLEGDERPRRRHEQRLNPSKPPMPHIAVATAIPPTTASPRGRDCAAATCAVSRKFGPGETVATDPIEATVKSCVDQCMRGLHESDVGTPWSPVSSFGTLLRLISLDQAGACRWRSARRRRALGRYGVANRFLRPVRNNLGIFGVEVSGSGPD